MNILKFRMDDHDMLAPMGRVLLVDHQFGPFPTLWIEGDYENSILPEANYFIRPTGQEYDDEAEFVGSAICDMFVWHVFRREKS